MPDYSGGGGHGAALSPTISNVATLEGTTNAAYTGFATAQSVAVTVGASGVLMVIISAECITNAVSTADGAVSFALSGANTLASNNDHSLGNSEDVAASANNWMRAGATFVLTGLTPGATTVTLQIRGDGTNLYRAQNRRLTVIPL